VQFCRPLSVVICGSDIELMMSKLGVQSSHDDDDHHGHNHKRRRRRRQAQHSDHVTSADDSMVCASYL